MTATGSAAATRIERVDVHCLRVPLLRPYRLAFGDLLAFDTLLVELADAQGRRGFGEATFLGGYGEELMTSAWPLARTLADDAVGKSSDAVRTMFARIGSRAPFAATAFMTALEMLCDSPVLRIDAPARVPLLGLLNADDERSAQQEFETLLAQGYRTVKLKIGLPGSDHLERVHLAQRVVAGRARIRIDANQAFSGPEAAALLDAMAPDDIELFEQPCAAGDWTAHALAARAARVPLMLDESIYAMADIERAAAEGAAKYIKLKLVKLVGLAELETALARIRALGMRAVLGNGVACDPGCWMEACVAARCIDNAGEMNGYLKQRTPLLANPPPVIDGAMCLAPRERPALDHGAVAAQRLEMHSARTTVVAGRTTSH